MNRRVSRNRRSRRDIAVAFFAVLLVGALPGSAYAEVFIASRSQPEFSIGSLFVSASVAKENLETVLSNPLTVSVSWSVSPP